MLHAMSGTVLVDGHAMQLRRIEGRIPSDVILGYGFLGTIHAGSSFSTEHAMEPGGDWKDVMVTMAIEGQGVARLRRSAGTSIWCIVSTNACQTTLAWRRRWLWFSDRAVKSVC